MLDSYDPNKDLDAMLHAVELPAGIAHLDSSLEDRRSNISNSDSISGLSSITCPTCTEMHSLILSKVGEESLVSAN